MKLREEFVLKALEPRANVAELCREFGISRKTAYKWIRRFRNHGIAALSDASRRPHSSPLRTTADIVVEVIRLRREHPRWGPKKLRVVLQRRGVDPVPSIRTVARVLDRAGEIRRRRPSPPEGATPSGAPRVDCEAPNDVWSIDFKGWWRTRDGQRCEPLTVRDAFSRYVLCLQVMTDTKGSTVQAVFERLFEQHGLPKALRMDNGSPFASTRARAGLTRLSAWWVSLGVRLVRGRPGHPQDNGAHERLHVDVRFDLEDVAAPTLALQQAECDRWRHEFNHVRPHEALGQRLPADVYSSSPRRYLGPRRTNYPFGFDERLVKRNGTVGFRGRQLFISEALAGYNLGIDASDDEVYRLWFYDIPLGDIDVPERAA